MRKVLLLVLCVAMTCISFQSNAQTFKFGHINSAEIWQFMPEVDSAQVQVERIRKEFVAILEDAETEVGKKYDEFQANQDKWSGPVKESKQTELIELQGRLQRQRENAQAKLQEEHQKLLEPVQKKYKDAVDKVGKANNFTYIFDISAGGLLYFNEIQSTDIGPLVKKELGITK
jgi:outer membrane protein